MTKINSRPKTAPSSSNVAVAYIRVSTRSQATKGGSADVQRKSLIEYAAQNGIDLPEENIFCDAPCSGMVSMEDRPSGAMAAKVLRSGKIGHFLVTDLDRFSRFYDEIYQWRQHFRAAGIRIHLTMQCGMVPDGAHADLMLSMLAQAAQMQREECSFDTARSLNLKRERGEKLGGPVPYGQEVWTDNDGVKRLRPHPREQAAIRRAKELREEGLSFYAVGRKLFEEGMPPRNGGPWHPHSIKNITKK